VGLALHAARLLRTALPRSVEAPNDLAARADCKMAAIMSGTASINAMVSVVHAIGHVVGGRYGLQHGISHGILLAPALRLMLPAIGAEKSYALEALGCAPDGTPEDAARAMEALLRRLPLPQRLGAVGVTAADLPGIAAQTMGDYMMANVPMPVTAADVEALLRSAL
jgi:alcohol dehydrogenase class IV